MQWSVSWSYSEEGEISRKFNLPPSCFALVFFFSWHRLMFPLPFRSSPFANDGARTVTVT